MADKGWISLHRQLLDCFIWQDRPFNRGAAWVDILLHANHEDKKIMFDGKAMVIGRGQWLTSIRNLSENWGWSKCKVTMFLKMLEDEGMVIKESDTKRTLLTVENYGIYQNVQDTKRTRNGNGAETNRKQIGTNNNDNNDNNEKQYIGAKYFPNNETLEKTFRDFIDMRKKIKKPMTDRAISMMLSKIQKYPPDEAVSMLEESILHSWQDIYPRKDKKEVNADESRINNANEYCKRHGIDLSHIDPDEPLPFV